MKKLLVAIVAVMLFAPSQASAGIKVGKTLKKVAHVVNAPMKHPQSAAKALAIGSFDTFLASFQAAGVVVEAVGVGVEKVGVVIVKVGGAIQGK